MCFGVCYYEIGDVDVDIYDYGGGKESKEVVGILYGEVLLWVKGILFLFSEMVVVVVLEMRMLFVGGYF